MSTASQPAAEPAKIATSGDLADHIKENIRRGRLEPGKRLVEADIMRETGASRGRVREALQRLAAEDLIVIQEFRGASVRRLTRDELQQNFHVRELLEGLCARSFVALASDAERAELAALQERMNACEASGDSEDFGKANDAWHRLIISGARNSYAEGFLERLRVPTVYFQFKRLFSLAALANSNRWHRRVTSAILGGDGELAERRMRDHIHEAAVNFGRSSDEFFD